jgi:hypothetical protein
MNVRSHMQGRLTLLVIAAVSMLFASCSASLVNKPAINKVKRVAVISVMANRGVHSMDTGGSKVGGLMAVASFLKKEPKPEEKKAEEVDFGGFKLVNTAVDNFTDELGKVKGWQAVHPSTFWDKPDFVKFSADMKTAADQQMGGVVGALQALALSATKLPRMPVMTPEVIAKVKEFCAAENLDGVVIISLDIAYDASFAVGGTGTANAAVGTTLHIINRDGDSAGSTENYQNAKTYFRKRSDGSTPMLAGEIIYNEPVEKLFLDSIQKDAVLIRETINEQI